MKFFAIFVAPTSLLGSLFTFWVAIGVFVVLMSAHLWWQRTERRRFDRACAECLRINQNLTPRDLRLGRGAYVLRGRLFFFSSVMKWDGTPAEFAYHFAFAQSAGLTKAPVITSQSPPNIGQ